METKIELVTRLATLLSEDELCDLVEALEAVINTRNGYGVIQVEVERKRILEIAVTSTVRPGK